MVHAEHFDAACVFHAHPHDDVYGGGFPGAVWTKQSVDSALGTVKSSGPSLNDGNFFSSPRITITFSVAIVPLFLLLL
jgi:hypothetical protein